MAHWPALLHGSGMRLLEWRQWRIKDVDLERHEVIVRQGKGCKGRITMLLASLVARLVDHIDGATMIYPHVLNRGGLGVKSPADRL